MLTQELLQILNNRYDLLVLAKYDRDKSYVQDIEGSYEWLRWVLEDIPGVEANRGERRRVLDGDRHLVETDIKAMKIVRLR